jgi:hypothetical protein
MTGAHIQLGPERVHLLDRHHPGVVVLMAGEGQAHALDRVGEKTGRLVGLRRGAKRLGQGGEVMAREIGHQRAELVIRERVDQRAHAAGFAHIGEQRLPPGRPALKGQRRIGRVRAFVDPAAQRGAARQPECGLQLLAVFQADDLPAHVPEQALEPAEQPVRHHRIQRLAVIIHHPPDIADVMFPAFQQGFVDVALVQLGVAGDRDMSGAGLGGIHEAVGPHIVLHQRGEAGQRHSEPDRAGGKVDFRAVLGAGGVGLGAAELPQAGHLFDGLAAEQVVDGVQHRPGMRFHGDPVLRAENFKIQRGHDRGDRGATGLVAADFQAVAVGAQMVGVMDHPGGQPEQFLLHRRQRVQGFPTRFDRPHLVHGGSVAQFLVRSPVAGSGRTGGVAARMSLAHARGNQAY